jgi:C1A family cysteine protease
MVTAQQRKYPLRRDTPDFRDLRYTTTRTVGLPAKVDLRGGFCDPWDQLDIGSCGPHGVEALYWFDRRRQDLPDMLPSMLFAYWACREMEGTTRSDAGVSLRDCIKIPIKVGTCPESMWRYRKANLYRRPSAACYAEACKHVALQYQRVARDITQMRACLAGGNPFVFGMSVYTEFESSEVAATGVADLPRQGESLLGGHAVVAVGYDDAQQRFIVRNSWGTGWGMRGHFTLPYAYLANPGLSADFWFLNSQVS